jgi:hypothetical protein
MVELTLEVSNSFAKKIQSFGLWSNIVLELNLENFKSESVKSAKDELIEFLSDNPTQQAVLDYFVSEENQKRLDYLLDLNGENQINLTQQEELKEWRRFNHIAAMLKIKAAKLINE